jgi:Ca2+-binding EF-hand superfamily protein
MFPVQVRDNLKELRHELSIADSDKLKWKEFLAATMDKNLAMREDKLRMVFEHFKQADSNYILVSDLESIMGEAPARELMSFVDSDGDGKLTYEDFLKVMKEARTESGDGLDKDEES